MWAIRLALVAAVWVAGAGPVRADIIYSWSGFVEPLGGTNPWGLSGDGSALTATDGTPYTIRVFVDQDARDIDTVNPRRAEFIPGAVELNIGGNTATFVRGIGALGGALSFGDNVVGLFDNISFLAEMSLFGTTLTFGTDIRIPINSFSLTDLGVDPPPLFATTSPVQFGGANVGSLLTIPANAPVSSELTAVPEPSSLALVGASAAGLFAAGVRRRRRRG